MGAPTTFRYTGQREESSLGLYYYGARWYDPALGHFVQPDTIIPNAADARAYDRYAYVLNNPLRYNDPSGYYSDEAIMNNLGCETWQCVEDNFQDGGAYAGLWGWLDTLKAAADGDTVETFVAYGQSGAHVTGQFATINGKIVINQPTMQIGPVVMGQIAAPVSQYAGSWSDLTFAQTALIGGLDPQHTAFYQSSHGAWDSAVGSYTPDCKHHDCVTQALDAASTGASVVASACLYTGVVPCAVVAGGTSSILGGVGAVRTWSSYRAGQTSMANALVATGTALAGTAGGSLGKGIVGVALSAFQWGWDYADLTQ